MSGSGAGRAHGSPDLVELLARIVSDVHDSMDEAHRGMDELLHNAAVGLLDALMPTVVHAKNALVRMENWTVLQAETAQMLSALGHTVVPTSVLAGHVAAKVQQGLGHVLSDLDYTSGVNSIT